MYNIIYDDYSTIPYLFQPIKYNDDLYVDGGLKGNFPIEACNFDNYLGINIKGGTCITKNFSLLDYLPILGFTMNLMNQSDNDIDLNDKMIFTYHINCGLNFDLDEDERKSIIEKGYNETIDYVSKSYR